VASPAQAQPHSVAPRPTEPALPPNHRQRDAQVQRELLEVLRTRWPVAFPQDPHLIRPLRRGVHQEIATHMPGTSLSLIKRTIVLFQRLSGSAYWRAVLNGGPRYALDGSPCGEVLPPEQEHARQTLALWKTQREARRQAAFSESGTPPSPADSGHAV
jgi:sRNA-binding protein